MPKLRPTQGKCHVCGKVGKLSFEHYPPRATGNNTMVKAYGFDRNFLFDPDVSKRKYIPLQQGFGQYTLCKECNEFAGKYYVPAYTDWCKQVKTVLSSTETDTKTVSLKMRINNPLAIMKQVLFIFFSVNNEKFREKHPELEAFICENDSTTFPKQYRLYAYLTKGNRLRSFPVVARCCLSDINAKPSVFSEFSATPLGYILTFSSPPPNDYLTDITFFSEFQVGSIIDLTTQFNILPTFSHVPADFRTEAQIMNNDSAVL